MQSIKWIALGLLLALVGCGSPATTTTSESTVDTVNTPVPADAEGSFTATDATGTAITLTEPAERIVCTTENCVDILAQLEVAPVAVLARNVGMAQDPRYLGDLAADVTTIGGSWFEPNIEDIITAQPDLVIGYAGVQDALRAPLADVAPVFLVAPLNYTDAIQDVANIGALTGRTAAADAAIAAFRTQLDTYADQASGDVTPLVMYGSDVNFGISTSESLLGSALAEVTNYPWPRPDNVEDLGGDIPYSLEQVLAIDPDLIFVETLTFGDPAVPPLSEQMAESPLWRELKAVQAEQVYEVDADVWHSGGGLRSVSIALDEAMELMYPDLFEAESTE